MRNMFDKRDLYYSFKTLVVRIDEMWFAPG